MSDKDTAAFEKWALSEGLSISRNMSVRWVEYQDDKTDHAWDAWEAARDRYAPKLTEAEAVAKAADAIHAVIHQAVVEPEARRMKRAAETALRAAGIKFRDEA